MCPSLKEVAAIIYEHHERFDGSGYPRGLKGDDISLPARIFAVADAYDAIRSNRPYAPSRSTKEAIAEISNQRGIMFDPEVVDAFMRCHAAIEEERCMGE